MTITAQTAKSGPYNGNGATTVFSYTFKVADEADLVVTVLNAAGTAETVKTLTTDYTVSGVGNAVGGSITMLVAPATGEKLTITRAVQIDQEIDLQNRGSVNPETLEQGLDKLTQISQDQQQQLDRSLKVDLFETADLDALTTNVNALAAIASDVSTVAGVAPNVTTVAGVSADVTTVAGIAADVTTVAAIDSDVTTVAADGVDIGVVAGISADVSSVAGVSANVTTVAGISADVTSVAGVSADVTTVATNVADVTNFADVYQGPKTSDPALRNDGSALVAGDLYFNTVAGSMRVYDGAAWAIVALTSADVLQVANNLSDLTNAATARTNLGAEAADADILKADTADVLTAGFAATPYNAGTQSSGTYTPDEANGNLQYAVNGGAHTLAPPTNNGTIIVQYTNNASAGSIITTGFTLVDGDSFDTIDGNDFLCFIVEHNGFSSLTVKALQ